MSRNQEHYSPVYSFRDGRYFKDTIQIDPIVEMTGLSGELEVTQARLAQAEGEIINLLLLSKTPWRDIEVCDD
jgi:hypothetical protein